MICEKCQDEGHYWFATKYDGMEEDEFDRCMEKLEETTGIYAYCDMRQVFSTLTECECGCHS